ncbi:MAG: helicase-related protein [Thermoleophilaceae bacterium]
MSAAAGRGLAELDLKLGYDSADEALRDFYVPSLARAVTYDRSVGYFRASALSVAARGLSRFIAGGGRMRLLVGAELAEEDAEAMRGATEVSTELASRLARSLATADDLERSRLEVLAWLAREGRLEVRVAIAVDRDGEPLVGEGQVPYFHEKVGVLRDEFGNGVAFQGSVNESATAWTRNFESFSVYRSWDASADYFDLWVEKLERRWAGEVPDFKVFALPEAVERELVALAPPEPPPVRDPEEAAEPPDPALVAKVLLTLPRTPAADGLADATTGVQLFPHQAQVVERLAGQYPRSWLVADEVGLGKTISAGMALRRLWLSGQVRRALILAPANVARQWQDELFEKFGLWVPRLEGGKLHGAHPDDVRPLPNGANPYELEPLLITSSHLARRPEQRRLIVAAAPFDLLIVDEAHHARRQGFADPSRYRPSRLQALLDELLERDMLEATWLTATPMQVHPLELRDLLRYVGLDGALVEWPTFERYFAELAKDDDGQVSWWRLARALRGTELPAHSGAEGAFLERVEAKLGPVARARVERFESMAEDPQATVEALGAAGRRELRAWLRLRGPVGQHVTRHSRSTLREYHRLGLLAEPVADRDVQALPIPFSSAESTLYDKLDDLIDRLTRAHGDRRGAGFVLTVYRRRLTSSWAAIRRTLERRLERERTMDLGEVLGEEAEAQGVDTGEGRVVDDRQAVPMSAEDLGEVEEFLREIERVEDSKIEQLRVDLDAARGSGQSTIVFTQFVDTLEDMRDHLLPAYRSHLATFTGAGGSQFREGEGWIPVSKRDLVEAVRTGRVSVVLATDAASEGLNLQSCSYLINYDLPWNPMRVEQRIGRIDRIGQRFATVTVRNYVVPGTVEERVYAALAGRIDDFSELLGSLQPILGATEDAFRRIFRAPRSEREAAIERELSGLGDKVTELEHSGIDLAGEDPLPVPGPAPASVTLEELERLVKDELGLAVASPGRPATFAPARASRDPETWTALSTYGHPAIETELGRLAEDWDADRSAVVLAEDTSGAASLVRADRTPPEPLTDVAALRSMGPAEARGEADELAARLVRETVGGRARRTEDLLRRRRSRWEEGVRERFKELVQETVTADLAVRGTQAAGLDPTVIWLELGTDTASGWQYAETFRLALGMELSELVPRGLADELPARVTPELRGRRGENGRAVLELMERWKGRGHEAS